MPRSSAPPRSGGAGSMLKLIKSPRGLDVSPKSLKALQMCKGDQKRRGRNTALKLILSWSGVKKMVPG